MWSPRRFLLSLVFWVQTPHETTLCMIHKLFRVCVFWVRFMYVRKDRYFNCESCLFIKLIKYLKTFPGVSVLNAFLYIDMGEIYIKKNLDRRIIMYIQYLVTYSMSCCRRGYVLIVYMSVCLFVLYV